jgi:hypothetical protein
MDTKKELELRLYGLTPYQLNGRQIGIQYGHSAIEYAVYVIDVILNNIKDKDIMQIADDYITWARKYKTFIILNGGTTNLNEDRLGTLNKHLQTLKDNNIFCSTFHEPDLGDQLTAVTFLVDERVFNKEKYPDFHFENDPIEIERAEINENFESYCKEVEKKKDDLYEKWVDSIGGQKNAFLREFLKDFKLA